MSGGAERRLLMNARHETEDPFRSRPQAGFTLVELLTVVAIIGLLSAVAVPAIARYMRNYRIRGAAQQVAGEIGAARTKAIARNTNLGVLFVTLSSSTYRWVIQDDPTVPGHPAVVHDADHDARAGGPAADAADRRRLRRRRRDDARRSGSTASADSARRARAAAAASPARPRRTTSGWTRAGQATVTLLQADTGLRRTVTVTPGGRVLAQP